MGGNIFLPYPTLQITSQASANISTGCSLWRYERHTAGTLLTVWEEAIGWKDDVVRVIYLAVGCPDAAGRRQIPQ